VPRFLSDDWVAAFNAALGGSDLRELTGTAADASLAAADGRFTVTEVVRDVPPDGDEVTITLRMDNGLVSLCRGTPSDAVEWAAAPAVTVSLSYADAAALSRSEFSPAEAIGSGRIKVRGDLSVLVASQALLAAAAGRLGPLQAETTY